MPSNAPISIAERLDRANVAIMNSLADAEIHAAVSAYGYDSAKLNEGKALYDKALAAVISHRASQGAQRVATQTLLDAKVTALDAYEALAKVARSIFKDEKPQLVVLGLKGKVPVSTAGFIAAATTLFNNAAGNAQLAKYGYDSARIASGRAKIVAYDESNLKQEAAKGVSQDSAQAQFAVMAELDAWRAQYFKIARVALRSKPQLLEKIGILARTSRRAARRKADSARE